MKERLQSQMNIEIEKDPETEQYCFKRTKIIWCPVGMQEETPERIKYFQWRNRRSKELKRPIRKMCLKNKLKSMIRFKTVGK